MADRPEEATIFAYHVGFGDCFLLRFTYADGDRRHILIDFGTTSLPPDAGDDWMLRIAKDIEAKCKEQGGALDIVVATHRHADHISGFTTAADGKGSGDIIAKLKPKVVVQPWTEAPDAPVDWEGPVVKDKHAFAAPRELARGDA
jgi:glyoxylase-like metal-dependent hydrolase (beta-lactamase superfamily II)